MIISLITAFRRSSPPHQIQPIKYPNVPGNVYIHVIMTKDLLLEFEGKKRTYPSEFF